MRIRLSAQTEPARRPRPALARVLTRLERLAERWGRGPEENETQAVGRKGEELAYWFLRERGYTIVARNYRQFSHPGEIDLIAWDGGTLVFIEVKTRSRRETEFPAELAVDAGKRAAMAQLARAYRRRRRADGRYRFDLVIVYGPEAADPQIALHRDALYE